MGIPDNEEVICSHLTYFYWWFKQPSETNMLHHLINSRLCKQKILLESLTLYYWQ